MLAKLYGSAVFGVNASTIIIEVNVLQGVKFHISGLPDNTIKESAHRVESAIRELGFEMPRQKVVVNLAPADIRKEGSAYDLPIALGVLKASGQFDSPDIEDYVIMGEITLEGKVRPIKGALSIAIEARRKKFKGLVLPKENADEAAIVDHLDVIGVDSLEESIDFFSNRIKIEPVKKDTREIFLHHNDRLDFDFSDVQGQENIKRAL